jgi:hypothetical protein
MSDRELMTRVADFPSVKLYQPDMAGSRTAEVIILRQVPDGTFLLGAALLVDVFCLGAQNAFSARLNSKLATAGVSGCPAGRFLRYLIRSSPLSLLPRPISISPLHIKSSSLKALPS